MTDTRLKDKLRTSGYSLTSARQKIYNALKDSPLGMASLEAILPTVNRASIYRNVKLFESLGIVHKLYVGWKYKVELTSAYHRHEHHMHCLKCGVIIPLPADPSLELQIESIAQKHGFSQAEHQLNISGHCANCV